MVLNLCLPHFNTSAHCNKLCADGYDVTNLVSADPALRRRGFKLEYFLRPPVQVTLKFGFQVELCRVDVELWPWGMDRGQACKKLEISTSSEASKAFSQGHKQGEQKEQKQGKYQNKQNLKIQQEFKSNSCQSNGHQWSLQAQQWVEQTLHEPQQRGHTSQSQTKTESSEPEFKLVGRCEVREETHVSFKRSNFSPRPPFLSSPPPLPTNCRQEELWSRGLLSLGAVTQLRVTVPYGGAASALGLKALTVWGQPARSCSGEDVERIKRVHETNERRLQRPAFSTSTVSQTKTPSHLITATPLSNLSVPEEFLDPITQEIMMLPMLLPSGVSVDNSTLEEHQKREATWGRAPNDPFTGVPFTSTSQPLPNPQLKSRIDLFLLQNGMKVKDGMLGRQGKGENPQASRLIASKMDAQSLVSSCHNKNSVSRNGVNVDNSNGNKTVEETRSGHLSENGNSTFSSQCLTTESSSELGSKRKQDRSEISKQSTEELMSEKQLLPQSKKPRIDTASSCSSHEQRLSASLDEALFSALQGRPSFTTNLPQQKPETSDSETQRRLLQSQTAGTASTRTGDKRCSACSCSVSVYSKTASSIYRLTCDHLLCGTCLRSESQSSSSVSGPASNHITCPSCLNSSQCSDIMRVHH